MAQTYWLIKICIFQESTYKSESMSDVLGNSYGLCNFYYDKDKVASISAFGNWLGDAILYPIDTISTRLKSSKKQTVSTINFVKQTILTDKLKLFRGVQLTFPSSFLPTFAYVLFYDYGMRKVTEQIEKHKYHQSKKLFFPFLVSSLSQILSLLLYLPVDTVRTRIQKDRKNKYQYKSFVSALWQIIRRQGFLRLYASSSIFFTCRTLQVGIIFQSFQLLLYFGNSSTVFSIFNTILSTTISTTLLNPFEVLITRYALVDTTKNKLQFLPFVKNMYHHEGFRGFYRGYPIELTHHCIYALCWLPLYQKARQKFEINHKND